MQKQTRARRLRLADNTCVGSNTAMLHYADMSATAVQRSCAHDSKHRLKQCMRLRPANMKRQRCGIEGNMRVRNDLSAECCGRGEVSARSSRRGLDPPRKNRAFSLSPGTTIPARPARVWHCRPAVLPAKQPSRIDFGLAEWRGRRRATQIGVADRVPTINRSERLACLLFESTPHARTPTSDHPRSMRPSQDCQQHICSVLESQALGNDQAGHRARRACAY